MSSFKYRIPIFSMIVLLLLANILYAGTTGKIAGKVLDIFEVIAE